MPLDSNSDDRFTITEEVTKADLRVLQASPSDVTVQFDAPIDPASFELLEREFFAHRPDATFRVYGHYAVEPDLSFLWLMPSVERFRADCLGAARRVECVAQLPRLKALHIGISDLTDFAFLAELPGDLETLGLGRTKSKRPSIAAVSRFTGLRELMVDAQHKGLDAVGDLAELSELRLWHYSNPTLDFLPRLTCLRRLEVNLGGGVDFSAIARVPALEELALHWIRRLEDLSFLAEMSSLESLLLDRLAQVRKLPNMSGLTALRELTVLGLKRFESAASIATAPALEELHYFAGEGNRVVDDIERVLESPSLRKIRAWMGRGKRKDAFAAAATERRIETELW